MKFKVTSAGNNSTLGDVFYTIPEAEEIKKAEKKIIEICNERVEKIYNGNSQILERTVRDRMNNEIEKMCATETAYHFLILQEIAKISQKEGCPIISLGNLSGSIISYLLGITEYNPFSISIEHHMPELIWGTDTRLVTPDFSIGIAKHIRSIIHRGLDSKYGFVVCNDDIFKQIPLIDVETCETLGVLSKTIGQRPPVREFNDEIYLRMVKNIADECIEEISKQKKEGYLNEEDFLHQHRFAEEMKQSTKWNFDSILRLYAYTVGSFSQKKNVSDLNNQNFFATRDEFLNKLLSYNVPVDVALDIVKKGVWSVGRKREKYIKELELYGVPKDIINYFSCVEHLWTSSACIGRLLHKYYMAWYQEKFPIEFAKTSQNNQ